MKWRPPASCFTQIIVDQLGDWILTKGFGEEIRNQFLGEQLAVGLFSWSSVVNLILVATAGGGRTTDCIFFIYTVTIRLWQNIVLYTHILYCAHGPCLSGCITGWLY